MALVDELNRARDISGDVRMRAMQQRPLSQIAAENVWRDTAANTPKPGAAPAPQTHRQPRAHQKFPVRHDS